MSTENNTRTATSLRKHNQASNLNRLKYLQNSAPTWKLKKRMVGTRRRMSARANGKVTKSAATPARGNAHIPFPLRSPIQSAPTVNHEVSAVIEYICPCDPKAIKRLI